jgi:hypothetical protein
MAFLRDGLTDAAKNKAVAALAPIAAELGGTMAQLAIAWVGQQPAREQRDHRRLAPGAVAGQPRRAGRCWRN